MKRKELKIDKDFLEDMMEIVESAMKLIDKMEKNRCKDPNWAAMRLIWGDLHHVRSRLWDLINEGK